MRKILIGAALGFSLIACVLALLGFQGQGSGTARVDGHVNMVPYGQTSPGPRSYPAAKVVITFERQGATNIFEKPTLTLPRTLPAATQLRFRLVCTSCNPRGFGMAHITLPTGTWDPENSPSSQASTE